MAGQFLRTCKLKTLLTDELLWDKIDTQLIPESGVYFIHLETNGKPESINRFLRTDTEGILYIGKANSFKDRVINAKKSIIYKSDAHEIGIRYYQLENSILESFPNTKLFCSLLQCDKPNEKESELINQYLKLFGELPPLNRNSPAMRNFQR